MDIIASVYIERENIGGYDPEDSWSRDSYDGSITEVTARPRRDSEPYGAYQYSSITKEKSLDVSLGDSVFVVVVGYTTGDTFGSDFTADVLDIFDNYDEAENLVVALKESVGYSPKPWEGYFESLRTLGVEQVIVRI